MSLNSQWTNANGTNDGNDPLNWTALHVPTTGEVAYYDNTSDADCTFSGNVSCDGLNATADYDGNLDFGDGLSHAWGSGGMVFDHTGTIDLGVGTTHTITGGPWDSLDIAAANVTEGTSTLVFKGVCQWDSAHFSDFYHVTIFAGATVTKTYGQSDIQGTVTADGDLILNQGLYIYGKVDINATGSIDVGWQDVLYLILIDAPGKGVTTLDGTISGLGQLRIYRCSNSVELLAPGDYSGLTGGVAVQAWSGEADQGWRASSGSYTFAHLELHTSHSAAATIDLATNNPTVTVEGDLTVNIDSTGNVEIDPGSNGLIVQGDIIDEITGGGLFVANDCPLTLAGTGDQDVDGCGGDWGVIEEDKSAGTVTLSGGLDGTSFTYTDGDLDPNGQTITTTGDCDIAAGCTFADLVGSTWNVGGNWTADGNNMSGNSGTWWLNVSETAVASGVGSVDYSDASGGTEIDASDGPWTDGGNNDNWSFGAAVMNQFQKANLGADLFNGALIA